MHFPCTCYVCSIKGTRNTIGNHICGARVEEYHSLTVKQLLDGTDKQCEEAAEQISSTWVPKLAKSGMFVAHSDAGKVSTST